MTCEKAHCQQGWDMQTGARRGRQAGGLWTLKQFTSCWKWEPFSILLHSRPVQTKYLSSYGPFKYGEKSKVETWISFREKVNSSGAHQARHQASPPPMSAASPVCQHLTFLTLLLLAYGWSYQRGFTENKKLKETGGFTQDLYSAEGLHTRCGLLLTLPAA